MDKLVEPYLVISKPNINEDVKFAFLNNASNQIMFQSLMRDEKDFASINLSTLSKHFKYSYRFSVKRENLWTPMGKGNLILPEFRDDTTGLKYCLQEHEGSDKLLVVFSSSANMKNTYNYFRTVRDLNCNKLYLADESLSDDKTKCSYYIGNNKNKDYESKIVSVINKIAHSKNITKNNIILMGSSKGGFASLYFAFKYNYGKCIVGSPTIYLGSHHKNSKFGKKIIENLAGSNNKEDIEWIDNLIINEINNHKSTPEIYYHVGKGESRYIHQGKDFMKRLSDIGKPVKEIDLGNYESHSDVSKFFPRYLIKTLNEKILK